MGEWIEVSAKTTEEAVTEALIQLATTSDKVEYEVLEKESRGFLGIGSRPARIRAKVKEEFLKAEEPVKKAEKTEKKQTARPAAERKSTAEKPAQTETQTAEKRGTQERSYYRENNRPYRRDSRNSNYEKETPEYKNPYSASSFKSAAAEENTAVKTEQPQKPEIVKEVVKIENPEELKQDAEKFLNDIFTTMGMQAKMEISFNEEETTIEIELEGEDMGILIGKRGQTLDSLQYLVSLVVNRKSNSYVKVKIDTENYRERRRETLENLAKNIAFKVKRTKKAVTLEPMNPYERRIIHSALQYDKFVETHSEGEEPYRKVVVTLKRNNREYGNRRGGKNYRRNYNNNYNSNYKRDYNNYRKARQAEKEAEKQASEE
jgi:spoIIIJ-associated protein